VVPEQISYSNTAPNGNVTNVTQLGPAVRTSFVIRNSGPSTIPTIRLVIKYVTNNNEKVQKQVCTFAGYVSKEKMAVLKLLA